VNDNDPRSLLRRELRARRRALSDDAQARAAESLAAFVAANPLFRAAHNIALYFPADGEIDPWLLMRRAWALGKRVFLPVLSPIRHDRLWFAAYDADTALVVNRFGIPEPRCTARHRVRAAALDLLLMPLVGFDDRGNRLGMGGGFYDKSLAFLRHRRCWHRPQLMGLAHACQQAPAIPVASWDVPLDAIATDQSVLHFPRAARAPL
jgi:5-formyltetrahydrofolate cyclo-ligase